MESQSTVLSSFTEHLPEIIGISKDSKSNREMTRLTNANKNILVINIFIGSTH